MANVVPIFIAPTPSLLHHNNVGIIYLGTSNLNVELLRFVPLYFMAMLQFNVIVTKVPYVITPTNIVASMRSKPQTPRETQLVNVHTKMPREVDNFFVKQPLDLRRGGSNPPRPIKPLGPLKPSKYFGLLTMDSTNHHYHQIGLIVNHLTILNM
jgi:hypothetical protein